MSQKYFNCHVLSSGLKVEIRWQKFDDERLDPIDLFVFQRKNAFFLKSIYRSTPPSPTYMEGFNFIFSFGINAQKESNLRQTHRGNLCIVPGGRSRGHSSSCRLLSCRFHCGRLPQLPVGLQGGEVVDGCKLDQGGKDERKADCNEPIHGCGVRNFGQGVAGTDTESCHGQDRGDACRKRRRVLAVWIFKRNSGFLRCVCSNSNNTILMFSANEAGK